MVDKRAQATTNESSFKKKRQKKSEKEDRIETCSQDNLKTNHDDDGEEMAVDTLNYDDAIAAAIAFEQLGSIESAIAAYERAIELQPTEYHTLLKLAELVSCQETNDARQYAVTLYERASHLSQGEKDAALWFQLGLAHTLLDQTKDAIEYLEKSCELAKQQLFESKEPSIERTYGMSLATLTQLIGGEQGDMETAIKLYQNAILSFPQNGNLHFNLGTLYTATEQKDKAIQCYQQAIDCDNCVMDYYEELLQVLNPKDPKRNEYEQRLQELRQEQEEKTEE